MNNKITLIIGMMTGIIITYLVCMVLLYINEKYEEEINGINNMNASIEKVDEGFRYIYILNRDIKKLERISDSDFYKFKVQNKNGSETETEISEYEFKKEESLELEEKYMVCDMRMNMVLKKSDLMTREEVLIYAEKNAKFDNCVLVEIPYKNDSQIYKQVETEIQDQIQDQNQDQNQNFTLHSYNNDYREILNNFSFDKTIYVDIYYQDKNTYEVIEVSKYIKVADITEEKIILIIPNDEARRVKDIMQNENLFIKES